jgi:hypothetical protein
MRALFFKGNKGSHGPQPWKLGVLMFLFTWATVAQEAPEDYFAGLGSFEVGEFGPLFANTSDGTSTVIPGWQVWRTGAGIGIWREDDEAQEGERFLELRARSGSLRGTSGIEFDFSLSPIPFTVGELYELSFWAAGGVATSGFNRIAVLGSVGSPGNGRVFDLPVYTDEEFAALNGQLEWQEFRVIGTAFNEDFNNFEGWTSLVNLWSAGGGGSSSVYLDNFSLRLVPEPSGLLLVGVAAGFGLMRRRGN